MSGVVPAPEPITRIDVHVQPRARRPGLAGRHGDAWRVRVSAPPVDGRANVAAAEVLAEVLGLPPRDVEVIGGHTSRRKVVEVRGLARDVVEERLSRASP